MYIIFNKENKRAGIGTQTDIKRPALFGRYCFFDTELVIINLKRQENEAK
jgi:hypothetical protein